MALREIMGGAAGNEDRLSDVDVTLSDTKVLFSPVPVEIGLVWSGLEAVDELDLPALGYPPMPCPIDAIAVGHYAGTTSLAGPERALDIAISRAALNARPDEAVSGGERILTSLSRRGVISGQVGQSFILPDPRVKERLIALAGMGTPGRFGTSELTFLVRELCWTLGRLGKRHLLAPVIGSGDENLGLGDSINAWVRGIRLALAGLEHDPRFRLSRVTFATPDARQIERLFRVLVKIRAIEEGRGENRPRLDIRLSPPALDGLRSRAGTALKDALARGERPEMEPQAKGQIVPARLTVVRVGKRLRFGALTETASIPERDVQVDPSLIVEANTRFRQLEDRTDQFGWGSYLGQLLLPREVQAKLASDAPLVMMLDADTAQIHWEMIAQVGPTMTGELPAITLDRDMVDTIMAKDFLPLGIARGVSRQLRTSFAPPPEPPPPPRRLLRVIVVADPADDLPAAREEGEAVARLFKTFNEAWKVDNYKVEVVTLIGSRQATRNDVLYHLTRRGPYDILHYAGHCTYDAEDPEASGWVFMNQQRLSVHELNRIDRVPRFIFSNACESGVLPDRPAIDAGALAPTFAEAFFAHGVSNFVCTAWSVDDQAAREFALELYSRLLGLTSTSRDRDRTFSADTENGPRPMYIAMREARKKILDIGRGGLRSWGAYQHYGDPYFQLFKPSQLRRGYGA